MTPSSATWLTVLASCREWRLSLWAGRGPRARTGRTTPWHCASGLRESGGAGLSRSSTMRGWTMLHTVGWPSAPGSSHGRRLMRRMRCWPRGQWITNEKTLLTRAGLRQVDEFIAAARPDPGVMRDVVDRSRAVCSDAVREAMATVERG